MKINPSIMRPITAWQCATLRGRKTNVLALATADANKEVIDRGDCVARTPGRDTM